MGYAMKEYHALPAHWDLNIESGQTAKAEFSFIVDDQHECGKTVPYSDYFMLPPDVMSTEMKQIEDSRSSVPLLTSSTRPKQPFQCFHRAADIRWLGGQPQMPVPILFSQSSSQPCPKQPHWCRQKSFVQLLNLI